MVCDGWVRISGRRECRYQNRCLTAWRYPNTVAVNRKLENMAGVQRIRTGNAVSKPVPYRWRYPSVQRLSVNGAGGET